MLKWLNEEVCFFLGSTKCRQGDGPSQPLRPSQMLTENPQPNKGSALRFMNAITLNECIYATIQ